MRLFFATQASHQTGMGHFMRCFALAEEAANHHLQSYFVMPEANEAVLHRLASIGAHWLTAQPNMRAACARQALTSNDWWVVDSYDIDAHFVAELHQGAKVLVFDDLCALPHYDCDLIVNASPAAFELPYARQAASARLLAGPAWSPVRQEFSAAMRPNESPDRQNLALLLGGSDARGLTSQVATVLRENFPKYHLHVIMGPAFESVPHMQELALKLGNVTLHHNPPALAQLLASTDLVITAAGGSIGELCALRQMAIALVVVDNQSSALQRCPYPALDARQDLPEQALVQTIAQALYQPAERQRIALAANALVDGLGCRRILNAMLQT